jgi:hypothetical protein
MAPPQTIYPDKEKVMKLLSVLGCNCGGLSITFDRAEVKEHKALK